MYKNNRDNIYEDRLKGSAVPKREKIKPDTPLRLSLAAALAFPDGSLKASGLRREAARGRLVIERIAGKDFTTLANIIKMRQICRVESNHPGSTSAARAGTSMASSERAPCGLSSMAASTSPQDALRAKIEQRSMPSQPTLQQNISPPEKSGTLKQ